MGYLVQKGTACGQVIRARTIIYIRVRSDGSGHGVWVGGLGLGLGSFAPPYSREACQVPSQEQELVLIEKQFAKPGSEGQGSGSSILLLLLL